MSNMYVSYVIVYRVTLDGLLRMLRKFSMKTGWISDTIDTSAKILVLVVLLLLLLKILTEIFFLSQGREKD